MKKLLTIVGVILVLLLIAAGVTGWLNNQNRGPSGPGRPGGPDQPSQSEAQPTPGNPPGCVGYEVIASPGTWESSPEDDPANPQSHPNSLLLQVTQPLQQEFGPDQVKVWTLPYPAQFKNFNAPQELTYDDSREQGYQKVQAEMQGMHDACPATRFVLVGFSQGAVLTGDLASEIGNGRGPVPAANIAGVSLIADGRREDGVGNLVGSKVISGIGAEIALNPVSGLIQGVIPGATMRGPRPGGFGELNDRVNNFCAPTDLVCDAPRDAINAVQRAKDLVAANAIHAQYATNSEVVGGETAPQWIVNWTRDIINQKN